VKVGILLLL